MAECVWGPYSVDSRGHPEFPCRTFPQIDMCGCDNPDIGLQDLARSNPDKFTDSNAQQKRLRIQWHFSCLIQEDGASIDRFEITFRSPVAPVKHPFHARTTRN